MNQETTEARPARIDVLLVILAAALAILIYLLTLAPTVSFWDSGEYITCAYVMGVPHPPGVPLFVLMGRFFTLLFSFVPAVAVRVNLMCMLAGVASVALVTRLLQRWGKRLGFAPALYRPLSLVGGLLSAFSYSVWRNNNATETYAMAHLFAFLTLWFFDRWMVSRMEGRPAGRLLLLVIYLMVLSVANHLSALIVVAPIILIYVLYALRGRTRSYRYPRLILLGLGLAVLAFSVHLYMPLRAVQRPEINETDPARYSAFKKALAREQYGQISILSRKGPFQDQLKLYMEYLSWQTGRPAAWQGKYGSTMPAVCGNLIRTGFVVFLLLGLWRLFRRGRHVSLVCLAGVISSLVMHVLLGLPVLLVDLAVGLSLLYWVVSLAGSRSYLSAGLVVGCVIILGIMGIWIPRLLVDLAVNLWNPMFLLRLLLTAGLVYGLVFLALNRPDLLLLIGLTFLMASFFFVVYLNFKTGEEGTPQGEVRERDYFFGASFTLFSILAAIGLFAAYRELARPAKGWAWVFLLLPAISVAMNAHTCDRSDTYIAQDYGINLLESCPENAVLVTNGDNDTFPLWFAQGVLGVRRDVIVSNLSLMNTTWYARQLLDRDPDLLSFAEAGVVDSLRPVFIWGPNFFHVRLSDGMPVRSRADGSLLRATFDQAWPWAVTQDDRALVVPSDGRGNQGSVAMQDLVLLDMIKNQPVHGREVYLAGTVSQDNRAYVKDYMRMEGIAFRVTEDLHDEDVDGSLGWENMQSYSLRGFADPGVYKCDQARQLARNYVLGYQRLAYHYLSRGRPDSVRIALDSAASLYTAMPEEWALILPSHATIEAMLIDGLRGPLAASEHMLSMADSMDVMVRRYGKDRLRTSVMAMRQYSSDYLLEQRYRSTLDSLSDGSVYSVWLGMETDLCFGNQLSAWNRLRSFARQNPDHELLPLLRLTMERALDRLGMRYRFSMSEAAISFVEQSRDSCTARQVLERMVGWVSRGRVLTAAAAGNALTGSMPPEQADLVDLYVDYVVSDPERARSTAEWFVLNHNRGCTEDLAYRAARNGLPALAYLALSVSAVEGAEEGSEGLLSDPHGYARSLPPPGRAAPGYRWVGSLSGS